MFNSSPGIPMKNKTLINAPAGGVSGGNRLNPLTSLANHPSITQTQNRPQGFSTLPRGTNNDAYTNAIKNRLGVLKNGGAV